MASKRKRLTSQGASLDSWTFSVIGAIIAVLGLVIVLVAFLAVPKARAETKPDPLKQIEQWLWPPRNKPAPAPVPVPAPPPQNETPAPPPPVVETVPPPVVVTPPPAPTPEPPKVEAPPPKKEPPVVDRPKPAPEPAPPPRKRLKRERTQDDRPVPKKPKGNQGACLPFFVSCSMVCSYARAGASIPAGTTACQIREGKACIRSHCPEVLKRR